MLVCQRSVIYGVQPLKTRISQRIYAVRLPINNLSVTSSNLWNIHIKYILNREQINGVGHRLNESLFFIHGILHCSSHVSHKQY